MATKARERDKLERLYRHITSAEVSEKSLSLTAQGKVHYEQKTLYRNGASHVIFEPLYFIARLAALVLKPRVCLTWFHGVLASIVFFIRHKLLWIGGCTDHKLYLNVRLQMNLPFASRSVNDVYWPKVAY